MGCVECSTNNAGVALLGVADFTNLSAVEASPCCARDYLVLNEVRPRSALADFATPLYCIVLIGKTALGLCLDIECMVP
jgi:hypothetical protein